MEQVDGGYLVAFIKGSFQCLISRNPDSTSLDCSHKPVIYFFGLVCLLIWLFYLPVFQTWKILCTWTHLHTHKLCVAGSHTQPWQEHHRHSTPCKVVLCLPTAASEMPVELCEEASNWTTHVNGFTMAAWKDRLTLWTLFLVALFCFWSFFEFSSLFADLWANSPTVELIN